MTLELVPPRPLLWEQARDLVPGWVLKAIRRVEAA